LAVEATDLERIAKERHGDQRGAELTALAANLIAGLAMVAAAELGDAEEPDFLDGTAAE
jgi:hypothetical protein